MMSSETYINVFFTKFSHNVDDLVLEGLCKFQVNEPTNARVLAVQSLGNLHTFIYCGSHDGGQNAHQPNFPPVGNFSCITLQIKQQELL